jgi:GNAT superfamily N-acetyltransferase
VVAIAFLIQAAKVRGWPRKLKSGGVKIGAVENCRIFVTCSMHLIEVNTPALARTFLEINPLIQQSDPHYIRPLDKDVADVFDPKKNKAFRFGEASRWVLFDAQHKPIGRIAAFVNKKYKNKGDELPVGGIGFFDCIHDQTAADTLFDVAKHWLLQKGMEAMDGPINFGERDRWWGLIVEGFQSPLYGMNYNPPYYRELFERYGFKCFYNQICFGLDPRKELSQKILDRHALIAMDPDFHARYLRKRNWEKYAMDFMEVYNRAWAGHAGMKELRKEQVMSLFKKMMPVVEEKIVWFAYHKQEPIALFLNLPDLNQWFKHLHGKFGLWEKLKFLWIKRTRPNPRFTGIAFGVVPEFQGKGIDSYLINEAKKVIQPLNRYESYELQWIGEFNPKMLNVAQSIGDTSPSRKLITYRYLFDRTRPFNTHPTL